jgi:predicted phosphodiesterase
MTDLLNIQLPRGTRVTVIGDVHEHEQQFNELVEKIKPSPENLLVSVGDLYDKGFGTSAAESVTRTIRGLTEKGLAYIVQGNHEVKRVRRSVTSGRPMSPELQWLAAQPLGISFVFANQTRLTIVHGGVKPSHTWKDLPSNSDLVYIRTLDDEGEYIPLRWITNDDGSRALKAKKPGKPWHEIYDGRFGYIASGHDAQKDGVPKFYKHSCNLDTACYATGIMTAQVFGEGGKEDLLQARGPAANKVPVFDTKP